MKIKNAEKYTNRLLEDLNFLKRKLIKNAYLLPKEDEQELYNTLYILEDLVFSICERIKLNKEENK